jgi:hypothetical protein
VLRTLIATDDARRCRTQSFVRLRLRVAFADVPSQLAAESRSHLLLQFGRNVSARLGSSSPADALQVVELTLAAMKRVVWVSGTSELRQAELHRTMLQGVLRPTTRNLVMSFLIA